MLLTVLQCTFITKDVQTCDDVLAKTVFDSVVVKDTSGILGGSIYWRHCLNAAETEKKEEKEKKQFETLKENNYNLGSLFKFKTCAALS